MEGDFNFIHICFSLFDKDGRYSKFTGTAILSLFENTTAEVTVHLLHDNTLTQDNRAKFIQLEKTYKQTIKFYNLEEICSDKIREFEKSIPTAVKRYSIQNGVEFLFNNPQYNCGDQEVWNYCFSKNYLKLPKKFNTPVEFARMNNDFDTDDRICHYITSSRGKGLGLDTNDAYNKLFLEYFIKTPWFNEESIGRLYQEIVNLYNGRQKNFLPVHRPIPRDS